MLLIEFKTIKKECKNHFENIEDDWCNNTKNKKHGYYASCCEELCPLSQNEKIKILEYYENYKKDLYSINNEIDSIITKINMGVKTKQFSKNIIESIKKLNQAKNIIKENLK